MIGTADQRATGWRMWVAPSTMMLCTLLGYIDRQVLAVLSPTILADTGLSAQDYTNVVSAFSILYMIGNPLWGSFLDYIGLRVGMLMAVTLWTAASVSHAGVGALWGSPARGRCWGSAKARHFPALCAPPPTRCRSTGSRAAWRWATAERRWVR